MIDVAHNFCSRVQCHVSLVGQWIDEAKEKLKDPGLVYPYHGQNRKRNAATLAQNSIVVTTYQTLASDATYHAKKGGADYCAPCEQVRWWRIICDESHSLREASTKKSMAIMNLVADNKWLVSGKCAVSLAEIKCKCIPNCLLSPLGPYT
jgi:SNF2 family DNA or RNA helicase